MKITIAELLCSTMRGLWGAVTPNLRKVSVEVVEDTIVLHFYYAEPPSEEEIDLAECAGTEVIADFPAPIMIDCKIEVAEMPTKIIQKGLLVYSRYEPSIDFNE